MRDVKDEGEPALDAEHLSRQTDGDRALERELLVLFGDQCARLLAEIGSGDSGRRREAAHTLKGAARAVGAWRVADVADLIEGEPGPAIPDGAHRRLARAVAEAEAAARARIAGIDLGDA